MQSPEIHGTFYFRGEICRPITNLPIRFLPDFRNFRNGYLLRSSTRYLDAFTLILSLVDSGYFSSPQITTVSLMDREIFRNRTAMAPGAVVSASTLIQREAFSRVPCRYFNSSKGYFI